MHVGFNAHLISAAPGYRKTGVSNYAEQLLKAMWWLPDAADLRWTVYSAPGVDAAYLDAPANAEIRPSRLPTGRAPGRIAWEQAVAPATLAVDRPDVLFCPLNVVPLLAPCPSVVTVHDLAFLRFDLHHRHKRAYLKLMTKLSAGRAAHVLTGSEAIRGEVIELLGIAPAKVTAVPHGLDPRFQPAPCGVAAEYRRREGLPEQFLLSVCTLEPRKELATLIKAYARIRSRLRMPLVVAGARGWREGGLFDLVSELGLGNDIRFLGFVPDVDLPLLYAAALAFVYPSQYEGFGLPPLEAMGVGTPVVTSDAEALAEVGDRATVRFPAGDVTALAAALELVAGEGSTSLRHRLSVDGLRRAEAFRWEDSARRTLDILRTHAEKR